MKNRRERFREAMARLDAAANPAHAIERGFYVERPGRSVAGDLAARLELRPASSHLLIGGIGSGKTTLLLVAQDRVNQFPEARAVYVDVSEKQDINRITPGVLIVLAGLAISELMEESERESVSSSAKSFHTWAHGRAYWEDSYTLVRENGLLSPPRPPLEADRVEAPPEFKRFPLAAEELAKLHGVIAKRIPNIVLLFDSLDRIVDPIAFAEVVEQDIRAIRWAGVGVVLAGPLRSIYGTDRPVTDRFDYFYYTPAIDIQHDHVGRNFLVRVLRAREPAEFLPDDVCLELARLSGGVLRDLIALAQLAVEEAYLDGVDHVAMIHVETAADAFGRKHMLGLGSDELEVLQRVRVHGTFVQTSNKDLALLMTRRVLEYQNGRTRYAVHPTIEPLLAQLAVEP